MRHMLKNNNIDNLQIVTLDPSQWEQYKLLRLEALQTDPQAFGRSYEEEQAYSAEKWQQRLRDSRNGVSHSYFASLNSRLIGMVEAKILHEKTATIAVIMHTFISKSYRNKGIARKLLQHVLKKLVARGGVTSIQLDVNTKQKEALQLYQSLGFTVIEEKKRLMGDGKLHDEFLMELNPHSMLQ